MDKAQKSIDPKSLGKVVLLLGGRSSEREVSLMSGKGVFDALQGAGVDFYACRDGAEAIEKAKSLGLEIEDYTPPSDDDTFDTEKRIAAEKTGAIETAPLKEDKRREKKSAEKDEKKDEKKDGGNKDGKDAE